MKLFFSIIFCFWLNQGFAQNNRQDEQNRLELLNSTLDLLTDSLAPNLNSKVNLSVSGLLIPELLRAVAESNDVNIAIDSRITIRVVNTFNGVTVKELLVYLCKEYDLDLRVYGSIISVFPYQRPEIAVKPKSFVVEYNPVNKLLSLELNKDSLAIVVKRISKLAGINVLVLPELTNVLVSGLINNLPVKSALEKLAISNGFKLKVLEDNVYLFEGMPVMDASFPQAQYTNSGRRPTQQGSSTFGSGAYGSGDLIVNYSTIQPRDSLLDVDAINASIIDLLKRASELVGKSYILQSEIQGTITCHIQAISYNDLLMLVLEPSNYSYNLVQNIYLIGDKKLEGLRESHLIKLRFRSVIDIEKVIPAELTNGLDLKIFKELNSIIVSGSGGQISKLNKFIQKIDEPVPNIMIEVIVAELRKGFSIQTGLTAFLSDSTVQTGGQLFGGVDLTLSSKSLNDVFGDWASKGWVNIGKVTPNFYAKLEALERNNHLNLRSTPKLSTLNGHEANLKIGNSVYYKIETQNVSGGVNPIVTVTPLFEKVEANLEIKINPIVSGNDHVTLDISAEFSDFISPEILGAPPGNATRKFTSKIRIKNEEMIILGGLEEKRESKGASGTPVLSRIPVLRWIFSRRVEEKSDNQLIVFIKPTIVY